MLHSGFPLPIAPLDEGLTVGRFHLSPFDKGDTAKPRGINALRNRINRFMNNPGSLNSPEGDLNSDFSAIKPE